MSTIETQPASTGRSRLARLRVALPIVFLVLVGWLVVREIGSDFDLPTVQRTLIGVPTAWAIGVALLALTSVAFTGLVDVAIARWLGITVRARELLRLAFVVPLCSSEL